MARVFLDNVSKRFGETVAVDHLTLEIKDKTFVVILGPSGSGKTTVLNLIAGLEEADAGDIYIGDELVNKMPPEKRNVAMVFQTYALYPYMNAFGNIAFPLKVKKVPKQEIEKRVKMAANMLAISHLLNRKTYEMSGGERQRVALARAMVRNPKVFLLDEPLSNLDAMLRVSTRTELKKLHNELGTTFVYVTHDQVEALTLADKVALLDRGKLQQFDAPDRLYNSPANVFVARFIGSPPINLLGCALVEKDDKAFLDADAFTLEISDDIKEIIKAKASTPELILGVRPEDITISKERLVPSSVKAEIYLLEPVGSEVIVDLMVGEEMLKVKSSPRFKASIGETVWIAFDMNKMHIFDKKTEEVLA